MEFRTMGLSARPHPMRLLRRELRRRGVRAIADLADVPAGRVVRVAGWPISAQRPPTAKGMAFLVLEDETGRIQVVITRTRSQTGILVRWHPLVLGQRIYALVKGWVQRRCAASWPQVEAHAEVGEGRHREAFSVKRLPQRSNEHPLPSLLLPCRMPVIALLAGHALLLQRYV
jgi:DNA polymerase III alpha subunit